MELALSLKVKEAFGFDPDPAFTAFHNATIQLGRTPYWSYHQIVKNLAFHDLTKNKSLPPATAALMGLGTKFIQVPPKTTSARDMENNLARLYRDVSLAAFFADAEEKPATNDEEPPTKLRLPSSWQPPAPPQAVYSRVMSFMRAVESSLRGRTAWPNLLPHQEALLSYFRETSDYVFANSDKGLGICGIEFDSYVEDALRNHLLVETDYRRLTEEEAWTRVREVHQSIVNWLRTHHCRLNGKAAAYIAGKMQESLEKDPFGKFYTLYKLHKKKVNGKYPTRPVCSDCASITHALGKWVDEQLQPIFRAQPTYIKNSIALKKELEKLNLRGKRYSLFKYDAVAMYVNANTDACLDELSTYLRCPETRRKFPHYEPEMLLEAIEIVMRNNIMSFGDCFFLQLSGVAMGISPAPSIASIFYAIYENIMLPKWKHCLHFVRRFIDDGFGIWIHDDDPSIDEANWTQFQAELNAFHGLTWEAEERTQSMDYMDMIVTIGDDGMITTDLFEKEMNLYQYLPPFSSHPPGVMTGLVMGGVLRILQICSSRTDADRHICNFYRRLLDRGHPPMSLLPLFDRAVSNAESYIANNSTGVKKTSTPVQQQKRDTIYFHIPYHPQDPRAKQWQELWQQHMVQPMNEPHISRIKCGNATFPIEKMTVCYSRHNNLGNFLSYRKLDRFKGRTVSSFLPRL